jgi:aldehyde dehydrogenase (NAD+)
VFNLVNGDGPTVGQAIASHPDVDMVSFTGSTRAGIEVARAAAPTVKRVSQELGGKSAEHHPRRRRLRGGDRRRHDGLRDEQRPVVQRAHAHARAALAPDEAVAIAKATAESISVGDPAAATTRIGPVVSEAQWNKIQGLIQKGIDEGATLVVGGPGRPEGLTRGYYVRPTVFADVRNDMSIAREEIFGPCSRSCPTRTRTTRSAIANETQYGLAGLRVVGQPRARAPRRSRIRAGQINVNGASPTSARRSAATSSRATAASGASSASRSSSRRRP